MTESHELFANYDVDDFSMAMPEEVSAAGAGAQAADALKWTTPVPLAVLLAVDNAAVAADGDAGVTAAGTDESAAPSRKEIEDADKMALQSYGRCVR